MSKSPLVLGSEQHLRLLLEPPFTLPSTRPNSLAECIHELQGQYEPPDWGHIASALGKRRRESLEDEDLPLPTSIPKPKASELRRTLVVVHPYNMGPIRNYTTGHWTDGTEMWEAWLRGDPIPGTLHAIKVMASEAIEWPAEIRDAGSGAREVAALYAEGRKWWEEGHACEVATVQEGDEADKAKAGSTDGELDSRTS